MVLSVRDLKSKLIIPAKEIRSLFSSSDGKLYIVFYRRVWYNGFVF